MTSNPYAAPLAALEGRGVGSPEVAVADREAHIRVERSLRSMGMLYMIGGGLMGVGALSLGVVVVGLVAGADGSRVGTDEAVMLGVIGSIYAVLSPLAMWSGWGMRRRTPAVRIPATVVACVSLLSIPVGTMMGTYVLYLLWSARGRRVFQPDYADVIAATPHVKVATSPVVKGVALVLLLGLVALIGLVLLGV